MTSAATARPTPSPAPALPAADEPARAGADVRVVASIGLSVAADVLGAVTDVRVGVFAHALLVFAFVEAARAASDRWVAALQVALALASLGRILALATIVPDLPPGTWPVLATLGLLVAGLAALRSLRLPAASVFLQPAWDWGVARVVLAAAVLTGIILGADARPWVDRLGVDPLPLLLLLPLAVAAEQLLYRGLLLASVSELHTSGRALLATVPFAAAYASSGSVFTVAAMFLLGFALARATLSTRSIAIAAAGHALMLATAIVLVAVA